MLWMVLSMGMFAQSGASFNRNMIETAVYNKNSLFTDWGTIDPTYTFPALTTRRTIFTCNLWVYGQDSTTNDIRGFGDRYFGSGEDTWPGPLTNDGTASTNASIVADFDKVFKVTQEEIDSFIANYNNGNVTSMLYPVPPDMINWPVNAAANFQHPQSPFYDHNSDGTYDVYDGDYPILKGEEMLRWIFNDNYSIHTAGLAPSMGAEIQADFYGCSDPDVTNPINRTTFLEYNIINRSSRSYKNLYIGLNMDADIGGYNDDYVRCNVGANTVQFYNGDSFDANVGGASGYGNAAPVQSFTILKIDGQTTQPLMDRFTYYNNSGGSPIGDPVDYEDHYNYLRGIWLDNSNMVYGGDGYPTGPLINSPPCKYMFPGDSDPTHIGTFGVNPGFAWTEENTGVVPSSNTPGDRRGLMSMGPFNLSAGESIRVVFALITTQDSTITTDSLLKKNIHEVNEITLGYQNETLPCNVGISLNVNEEDPGDKVTLFPSPTRDWLNIQTSLQITKTEILNMQGSVINTYNNINHMNLESLTEGMYFARVYLNGYDTPVVKKIIVVK